MTQTIDHDRDEAIARALVIARQPRAAGGAPDAAGDLSALQSKWDNQGADVSLQAHQSKPLLTLGKIVVPKEQRGQGIGHSVMDDITSHADRFGKTVALTPSTDFGASSVARLKDFYKPHGFVENKGRNKDYSISESMYRPPRAARAEGGGFSVARHKAPGIEIPKTTHVGPIHSPVAGRTDHLPMEVDSGSYVLPADVVSAHGEGNSIAGFKVLKRVFGGVPYNSGSSPYGVSGGPYGSPAPHRAGGDAKGSGVVPIVAAGGEMVLSPEQVRRVGGGDLETGHRVLDEFVKRSRAKLVSTLRKLPGPAK